MNVLRGLLFQNLGLKFAALLLAVLVYLNAYSDRPDTMLVSFPVEYTGLDDTLAIAGNAPSVVQAELQGTRKQILMLRLKEPRLQVPLEGVRAGHFERVVAPADLPLPADAGVSVANLLGPLTLALDVDRKVRREVPLAARVQGRAAEGSEWNGMALLEPAAVTVVGPERAFADLDSMRLLPVSIEGKRDTVTAKVAPERLPEGCLVSPALVRVRLPIRRVAR